MPAKKKAPGSPGLCIHSPKTGLPALRLAEEEPPDE